MYGAQVIYGLIIKNNLTGHENLLTESPRRQTPIHDTEKRMGEKVRSESDDGVVGDGNPRGELETGKIFGGNNNQRQGDRV